MKKKYHISPDDMMRRLCGATEYPCPFKIPEDEHEFLTSQEVKDLNEETVSRSRETFPTIKKKKPSLTTSDIMSSLPTPEQLSRMTEIHNKYNLQGNEYTPINELINNPDDFFFAMSFVSAQRKSTPIENFITDKLKGDSVLASQDRGDFKIRDTYYELKTSTTNQNESLNIRQIRPWQELNYYICSYIDERNLEKSRTFKLSSQEMKEEVAKIGGVMHGTKSAVHDNTNKEYGIVINVFNENNSNTNRWMEKYWFDELYQIVTGGRQR